MGYALRPGSRIEGLGALSKGIGLAFLFVVGTSIIAASNEYFEIEDLNRDSLEAEFDETSTQTTQGGSSFAAPDPFSPIGYPYAIVTVIMRPFPFEVDNLQMAITSAEGLLLAALLTKSLPRIVRTPGLLRQTPYLAVAISYVLVFAFAFASIGNFGILARQRVQMLPFLFILLCLPLPGSASTTTGRARKSTAAGT